jgi:UDPglucose 6-dehydrogenase
MTEWNEFRGLDLARVLASMAHPVIVDARNVLDPAETRALGFTYVGTGRGAAPHPVGTAV